MFWKLGNLVQTSCSSPKLLYYFLQPAMNFGFYAMLSLCQSARYFLIQDHPRNEAIWLNYYYYYYYYLNHVIHVTPCSWILNRLNLFYRWSGPCILTVCNGATYPYYRGLWGASIKTNHVNYTSYHSIAQTETSKYHSSFIRASFLDYTLRSFHFIFLLQPCNTVTSGAKLSVWWSEVLLMRFHANLLITRILIITFW